MGQKKCGKCNQVKDTSDFNRAKSRKDGFQSSCKDCLKAYRDANKHKAKAYNARYQKEKKEQIKEQKRKYRERNKEEIREGKKLWKREKRARHKEELLTKHQSGECLNEEEQRLVEHWIRSDFLQSLSVEERELLKKKEREKYREENKERIKEQRKKWKEENKEKIKEQGKKYREENKEWIRLKSEAKKVWSVYRINFNDNTYYIGMSNRPDMRFNKHKSLSLRGLAQDAFNQKDWSDASYEILSQHKSEADCLDEENKLIGEMMNDPNCLNQKTEKRSKHYWVYVIQSEQKRYGKNGKELPGFFYVGMTTDPTRRLREHNGLYANGKEGNPKGGKYTSKHRPWVARACFGPYASRSEALKAEYKLKRTKRGASRCKWSSKDSPLCVGLGEAHPWVSDSSGWKPPK
jgi:predicted GIY-YIG superfamily endonuclease